MLRYYTLLLCVLACTSFPFLGTAQSSIYQDAVLLADFLEASKAPLLTFDLQGKAKPSYRLYGGDPQVQEKPSFRFPEFGFYQVSSTKPDSNYSLSVHLPDTMLLFEPFDSVGFWFQLDTLEVWAGTGDSVLFKIPSWSSISRYSNAPYRLAYHTDFDRILEPGYQFSFEQVLENYQNNPFVPSAWRENPFLDLDENLLVTINEFEQDTFDFSNNFFSEYPWQRLLSGDSTLEVKQAVSFEATTSSYRQPIITSQRALDVSSTRINQTSRNRGLLDAQTVATGLSDFIAERAQEELNLTFFNRFKENLNKKESELTMLFPNTKDLLLKFEISNYKTLLAHARTSFELDLDNLGVNFPKILTLDKYQSLNNDPNVFNLSLIYSIADLAYKEQPVETILMSAHQMLYERQINLQQSIHQSLADTLIAMNNGRLSLGNNGDDKLKNRLQINGSSMAVQDLLDTVRVQTLAYLDAVHDVSFALHFFAGDGLLTKYQEEYSTLEAAYYDAPVGASIDQVWFNNQADLLKIGENINNSNRYLELVGYQQGDNIEYQNRTLDAYYTHFDHFKNVIPAHLSGQEYYGYILEQPRRGDYDQYFVAPPPPEKVLVAQGFDEVRLLLQRDYAPKMRAFQRLLNQHLRTIRVTKAERLRCQNANNERLQQVVAFDQRFQLLASALEREIGFWMTVTGEGEYNRYIAGLQFLRNYLHNSQETETDATDKNDKKSHEGVDNQSIWRVRQLAHYLNGSPDNYERIMNRPEFGPLKQNYSAAFQQAEERMAYIQAGLAQQVGLLVQRYGDLELPSSVYQQGIVTADYQEKSQLYREQLYFLEQQEYALREQLFGGDHYERVDSILSADQDFNNLQFQLEQLYYRLYNEDIPETELDSLVRLRDEKQMMVDEKYVDLNREPEQAFQAWYTANGMEAKKAEMYTKMGVLDSIFYYTEPPVVTIDSLIRIGDAYDFGANTSYQSYMDQLQNRGQRTDYVFGDLDTLSEQLVDLSIRVQSVQDQEDRLQQLLDTLERAYCSNLVDAKTNADNLAKSVEISAHLLFAFRDYERTYDTLFYQDSVYIEVTISEIDSITGLVNTYKSDSLQIVRRPVPGTTKPVTAARWITRDEFDELRTDEVRWNIFLALLYQRLNSIKDGPNFSPNGVALLATKFLQIANDVEINLNQLRRKKAEGQDKVVFKDYYPFIRSTVDLFNTVLVTKSINSPANPNVLLSFVDQGNSYSPLGLIPRISNEALSLYENIYVKDYGNAILNAMELLKLIASNELDKKGRAQSGRAINAVLTYGTFMANMINAESSDQVKNILQAATLPPGSSRIKREVSSNFTINSYLGAGLGVDRLLDAPSDLESNSFGAALSVPIGMTYSFSPNFIKNKSSFSLHIPLLDLGAITAYRQSPQNSPYSVSQLPDFTWENLFSPGVFAVYNFANSPFSLGFGGQYGPQLREIKIETGDPLFLNSWRFPMVFFTIDVPFFNLHTGPRKIVVD